MSSTDPPSSSRRPDIVSRATSAPQPTSPKPTSTSNSAPSNTTITSSVSEDPPARPSSQPQLELDEDEVLAQATACALQAQQELAKIQKQKQQPLNIFAALESNLNFDNIMNGGNSGGSNSNNNNGNGIGGIGGNLTMNKPKLPLGDIQQRKLIEKKLGHAVEEHQNTMMMDHGGNNGLTSPQQIMNNLQADVKEKFENLFPQKNQQQQQQNQQQSQQQDATGVTTKKMTSSTGNTIGTSSSTSSRTSSPTTRSAIATTTTTSTTTPAEQTPAVIPSKPTLSANVWKRRNGYGKYSINAWERRRLDLVGTKIMYYKKITDGKITTTTTTTTTAVAATTSNDGRTPSPNSRKMQLDQHQSEQSPQQQLPSNDQDIISTSSTINESKSHDNHSVVNPPDPPEDNNNSSNTTTLVSNQLQQHLEPPTTTPSTSSSSSSSNKPHKKDIHQLWENAKQNITKSINELSINNNKFSSDPNSNNNDDPDSPRGCIDLQKENVTVSAISDHEKSSTQNGLSSLTSVTLSSVSPTPYGLCIVTKGDQQKWKLCFDSHGEQVKWLTILTEIIVRKSVEAYNQELVKSKNSVSSTTLSSLSATSLSVPNGGEFSAGGGVGGVGSSSTLDSFRHAPQRKDGMWNIDEKFSYRNLMVIDEKDEDVHEIEFENVAEGNETVASQSNSSSLDSTPLMKRTEPTKKTEKVMEDEPIISDLPIQIADLVQKGAKEGPDLLMKGYNLCFAFGIVNLSLFWIYVTPVHWLVFPIYLILVNIMLLVVSTIQVEKLITREGSLKVESVGNNNRIELTRIRNSVRQLRSSLQRSPKKESSAFKNKKELDMKKKDSSTSSTTGETTTNEIKASTVQKPLKKPIAGTTTKRLLDENESHFVNNHKFISWSSHPPQEVQVRSHGYLKSKKKIPCPKSLYEVTNVEVLASDLRVAEMASKVVLPKATFDDEGNESKRWKSPDSFVVSLAVPTEEPSFTRSTEDGFGINLTIYYRMKKETRDILKRITTPGYNRAMDSSENDTDVQRRVINGVMLWEEWCSKAPSDADWQARFKLIPNILNPVEVGLPSWISKYCGKPVLIKRRGKTGFLSTHADVNAFEFDISLHVFPYLAKKAMAYLSSTVFKKALISIAYVVEARSDDELPETLIGDAVKFYYADPDIFISANDYFAGTSPKSVKSE